MSTAEQLIENMSKLPCKNDFEGGQKCHIKLFFLNCWCKYQYCPFIFDLKFGDGDGPNFCRVK